MENEFSFYMKNSVISCDVVYFKTFFIPKKMRKVILTMSTQLSSLYLSLGLSYLMFQS